jgi:predicted ferric reductase
MVAASQLPLHYLLAVKTPYSPLQFFLKLSHESLNSVHRVSGRIILVILSLHANFYLNFFVQASVFQKRIKDTDVILGLTAFLSLSLLGVTSLASFRQRSYRWFYTVHVIASTAAIPILFFHVSHLRIYIFECFLIQFFNIAFRLAHTKKATTQIRTLPNTNLVQITSTLPGIWKPGEHYYLRFKSPGFMSYLQSNPLTICSLPEDQHTLLVARALNGHTQNLVKFLPNSSPTVFLEGPYGDSKYLPDLNGFETILLVAGGVGATYIIPLWKFITRKQTARQHLKLIWTVRAMSDASWAFPLFTDVRAEGQSKADLCLHITSAGETETGSIELAEPLGSSYKSAAEDAGFSVQAGRPDLGAVTDDIFRSQSGRIAIFVCGPSSLSNQLRDQVGRWVVGGRDSEVFWHAEAFDF